MTKKSKETAVTPQELTVNGIVYVPKVYQKQMAECPNGLPYVVVRTFSAGVHIGFLSKIEGNTVELLYSRRLWGWKGAFTLSEVALNGVDKTSRLASCLPKILINGWIEIIPATVDAQKIIQEIPVYEP